MKKNYFVTILLALSVFAMSAEPVAVEALKNGLFAKRVASVAAPAAEGECITSQPEGTLYPNMSKSAHQYETSMGFLYDYDMDGIVSDVVVSDDALYVRDPLSLSVFGFDANFWMKGEKAEGDTIVFKYQPIFKLKTADDFGRPITETIYLAKLKMIITSYWDEEWEMEIQEVDIQLAEDTSVKFTWKDETLTLVDMAEDEIVGIVMSDGYFAGVGEKNSVFTKLNVTQTELPDGAVAEDWQVRFINEETQEDGTLVKVITSGNEVFLGNLPNAQENKWIKGSISGSKVVFPSNQYLGISPKTGCHATFYGADVNINYDPELNEYDAEVSPTEQVTFTYDAVKKTMSSEDNMVINAGMVETSIYSIMTAPDMKLYSVSGVLTPADPVITYYQPYGGEQWQIGVARFTIPRFDVNGDYLDPEKMYYNIYFDEEKVEFYSDEYLMMEDGTTDVPCTYNDQYSIWYSGANYTINFYDGGFEKFGIQVFYKDGDDVRSSKLVYYGDSGVEDKFVDAEAIGVTYTDLMGRIVNNPVAGLYLKIVKYSDGTAKVEKIVVK